MSALAGALVHNLSDLMADSSVAADGNGSAVAAAPGGTPLYRAIVGSAVALSLLYGVLYAIWGTGEFIGDTPWYIPTMHSFVGLAAFLVGFVALGRFRVLHEPATFWVGTGFVALGIQSIVLILTWPGLMPDGSGVIARLPSTSAWVAFIQLSTLTVCLYGSALARWPVAGTLTRRSEFWLVTTCVLVAVAPCLVAVIRESTAPRLVDATGGFLWFSVAVSVSFGAAFAAGAAISTRRYRRTGDPLQGYISITQVAMVFVVLSVLIGGRRFDVWYYVGRAVLAAGFLAMLFGLLADYVGLFSRERDNTARLLARSAELEQAQRRLQEADRRKDEYLSMLSHELRNPLAAISTAVVVAAKQTHGQGDVTRVIEVAGRQVHHMTRLLDDLLDVARITRGRISLRREPVDIAQAVNAALEIVAPKIQGRGHHVTVTHQSPVVVDGDRVRLSQIFANLLDNAAKYTPNGGRIAVTVSLDGRDAVISVRDSGKGIPPDLLPYIFETFERGQVSMGSIEGGLGLGLALVRRLAELHGGAVQAIDRGDGAEFVVRLPASASVRPEPDIQPTVAIPDRSRPRVLVVDDNKDAADMLSMWLEMEGYPVESATSGRAALDRAEAQPPDVVLLDLGMPEMDGYELARRLRAMPRLQTVRVVAVSGYGEEEYRRRAREAGIVEHLVKPVDIDTLIGAIEARGPAHA